MFLLFLLFPFRFLFSLLSSLIFFSSSSLSLSLFRSLFLIATFVFVRNSSVFSTPTFVCRRTLRLALHPNPSCSSLCCTRSFLQLRRRCSGVSLPPQEHRSLSECPNFAK